MAAGRAFDADNTYSYLNNIPFSDHGALLDPPTEDVTARCISMLAQLPSDVEGDRAIEAGIEYLRTHAAARMARGTAAGA